jgi:hypothetical protein
MENKKLIAETVNRFNDILKYDSKQSIRPLDEYSNELVKLKSVKPGIFYEYKNCGNNNLILEGSFKRVISFLKDKNWAILSAYCQYFSLKQNILRNRILRGH